jgi:hypothetical protein
VSSQVFVDETKHRGYLLVAGVVVPGDLDDVRRMLRGLVLPGQRRLHMNDENDQRRRSIATAIAVSGVTATMAARGYQHKFRVTRHRERRSNSPPLLTLRHQLLATAHSRRPEDHLNEAHSPHQSRQRLHRWKFTPPRIMTPRTAATSQSTVTQKGGHQRVLATNLERSCHRSFSP